MSRDYKSQPNSTVSGKSGGSLFLGLFIGYALGLLSAMGVWMYINQAPSPFVAQDRPAESAAQTAKPAAGGEDKPVGKPRFEFYKILPGTEEPVTEQQIKQAAQQPASKDSYFIQAGAFQNADDADNLKARLAMLGTEASVQSVDLAEKGIWHRVRLGPFTEIDEINRVRASLQQNGIQTSLIKVHEAAQ